MTRSLLVYLPGYPYAAETLTPQHMLAAMAGALMDAGHETQILDFGVVEELGTLTSGRLANALLGASAADLWEERAGVCSRWTARRRRRTLTRMIRAAEARQWATTAAELGTHTGLDFIVLHVPRREDVAPALALASIVRAASPSIRILASGRHAERYASFVIEAAPAIDACIVGDVEPAIIAVADHVRAPETWSGLPNLVIRDGARAFATPREEVLRLDGLPRPSYRREVYPALYHGGKFRLFPVRESRGSDHLPHATPRPPFEAFQARVRSPRKVCDELRGLGRDCGARAFHFLGDATPAATFDALCYEILAECLRV
ncbi:MAG TPA: hypothetical protein PKI11_17870, partial [Candidatus Hydrogenedentes bacterium]|nr:hypothetical protein [Candidatus Hydrogenedentota bacterium]